jgi:uncharacterized membrane protein YedE/YeeE
MALRGRILGAMGILGGVLLPTSRAEAGWRLWLLAGMVGGPLLHRLLFGAGPEIAVPVSTPALVAGGLVVGLGVTWGSGCTSGHGVCGLARRSPRSMAATATFMATAFATVYVTRHLIGA